MDLLKQPSRNASRHGRVQTEFLRWLKEAISELVDEIEAVGEFIRRDCSDVGGTLMMEFNSETSVEDVQVWTGIECRTYPISQYYLQNNEYHIIGIQMMKKVSY